MYSSLHTVLHVHTDLNYSSILQFHFIIFRYNEFETVGCYVFRNGFREGTVAKKRVSAQGAPTAASAK